MCGENSGSHPIARRRDTSTTYAHAANEVHTSLTLQRHDKRRRVTNDEPSSEAARTDGRTCEPKNCLPEDIKAVNGHQPCVSKKASSRTSTSERADSPRPMHAQNLVGANGRRPCRPTPEVAVRQHKAWHCSSRKDRARAEGDGSNSSDAHAERFCIDTSAPQPTRLTDTHTRIHAPAHTCAHAQEAKKWTDEDSVLNPLPALIGKIAFPPKKVTAEDSLVGSETPRGLHHDPTRETAGSPRQSRVRA